MAFRTADPWRVGVPDVSEVHKVRNKERTEFGAEYLEGFIGGVADRLTAHLSRLLPRRRGGNCLCL